jgi:uncharacterized DUF497 family protein
MIEYEWSEEKRRKNLKKHKLDSRAAKHVYEHHNKITVPDEYPYEDRFLDFAEMGGAVKVLVYTMRGSKVRCISFRSATRSEREFYYEEIANR